MARTLPCFAKETGQRPPPLLPFSMEKVPLLYFSNRNDPQMPLFLLASALSTAHPQTSPGLFIGHAVPIPLSRFPKPRSLLLSRAGNDTGTAGAPKQCAGLPVRMDTPPAPMSLLISSRQARAMPQCSAESSRRWAGGKGSRHGGGALSLAHPHLIGL